MLCIQVFSGNTYKEQDLPVRHVFIRAFYTRYVKFHVTRWATTMPTLSLRVEIYGKRIGKKLNSDVIKNTGVSQFLKKECLCWFVQYLLKLIMDYFCFVLAYLALIHNSPLQSRGRVACGYEHLLQCFKFSISADTTGQHTQRQQVLVCWVRWRCAIPRNRPQAKQPRHRDHYSRSCRRGRLGWDLHGFLWTFWWHMETI